MFDRTVGGSTLKWLLIVDEYTRKCFVWNVDQSITSEDVIFMAHDVRRHLSFEPRAGAAITAIKNAELGPN